MKRLVLPLTYGLALIASHLFCVLRDPPAIASQGAGCMGDRGHIATKHQGVAFLEWGSRAETPATLVLLTDPRDQASQFEPWCRVWQAESGHIITVGPVLGSRQDLATPDVGDLINGLSTVLQEPSGRPADLVAIGANGPTGIELAARAPDLFRSLTLISAMGLEAFQHLGDHHLNQALYSAQAFFSWTLRNLIPHFGVLDRVPWDPRWIDTLQEMDLRSVRENVAAIDMPVMVIVDPTHPYVPVEAAREFHRILPQSRLEIPTNASDPERAEASAVAAWQSFLDAVRRGTALTRHQASPQRLKAAAAPFDTSNLPPLRGSHLWIALLLIALATLISEDLTCISAGLMVSRGMLGFLPAAAATLVGIFVGDVLLFLAGRWIGRPALKRIPLKWLIDASEIERCGRWFDAKGPKIIIASRFLPGTRLPTYFGAGMMGASFWTFTFFFLIACTLWTPMLVGIAALVGKEVLALFSIYERWALPALLLTIAALWILLKIVVPLLSFRGRRLLKAAWTRKIHWEFWPPYVFYPPLVLYVLYLGLRHRSLTLFTAANPAIDTGGFVGESKSYILNALRHANDRLARFVTVPPHPDPTVRADRVRSFMTGSRLEFPIVLKPDVGERGRDVTIIKEFEQLAEYFRRIEATVIAQEFVPGREFGIFYYRFPGAERGHILSITDKRLLSVTGDGKHNLEELILRDDRAVLMASIHMKNHRDRLYETPPKGREITLVEVGTHCRGSVFLDGNALKTPQLEQEIDRISRSFKGFYFGRYDVRCGSVEGLKQGTDFKILELNGVTSEATHIYDPKNSLFAAYTVLKRQWRLAFEIGAANRKLGVQPVRLRSLVRAISKKFNRFRNRR